MYQAGVHHPTMQPTYMPGDSAGSYLHGNSGASPVYVPTTRYSMFSTPGMNNGYMHGSTTSTGISPPTGQLSPSAVVPAAASGVWGQHDSVTPGSGNVLGSGSMYSGAVSGGRYQFSPSPSPPAGARSSLSSSAPIQPATPLTTAAASTPSLLEMSAGQTSISPPHQYGRSPYGTSAYMPGSDLSAAWGSVGYGSPHTHGLGFAGAAAAAIQQGYMPGYGE